jgi:hypothetical protein
MTFAPLLPVTLTGEELRDIKVGLVASLNHGYEKCNPGYDDRCFVCAGLAVVFRHWTLAPPEPETEEAPPEPETEGPPVPEWSLPPNGPWCLKQWLPLGVPEPKYDACLLGLDHDGDCRGIHGKWINANSHLILEQLNTDHPLSSSQLDKRALWQKFVHTGRNGN